MNQRTNIVPPEVEYHRVLAGEKRRIGRGILAIALLTGGMSIFGLIFVVAAAAIDAATGASGGPSYSPLIHTAGLASVALLIPWSMFIQRWLYGVKGPSLHSVISRFRFDIFGRSLLFIMPMWLVAVAVQYWSPLPQTDWAYANVLWFILATLLLTPLQAAGEEYGFRGLIFRVAGGWARGARAGLVVGIVVSTLIFAAVHLSSDPWLNVWYLFFGVGTALITWRTGGIEIAVVMHAGFNTLQFMLDAALRADLDVANDRGAGSQPMSMTLLLGAIMTVVTLVVWLRTRRTGPARTPSLPSLNWDAFPAPSMADTSLGRASSIDETRARID